MSWCHTWQEAAPKKKFFSKQIVQHGGEEGFQAKGKEWGGKNKLEKEWENELLVTETLLWWKSHVCFVRRHLSWNLNCWRRERSLGLFPHSLRACCARIPGGRGLCNRLDSFSGKNGPCSCFGSVEGCSKYEWRCPCNPVIANAKHPFC